MEKGSEWDLFQPDQERLQNVEQEGGLLSRPKLPPPPGKLEVAAVGARVEPQQPAGESPRGLVCSLRQGHSITRRWRTFV